LPEVFGVSRDRVVETTISGNWKGLLEFGFNILPLEAK
jgi:hypothetical protein